MNVDDLLISQPDTGEQALEIADMLIRSGALDVLVIDSVAALTPRAEIEGEMGDSHVGSASTTHVAGVAQADRHAVEDQHHRRLHQPAAGEDRCPLRVLLLCARVVLADGTTEKIGKIVNQRLPVEVLSYDPKVGAVVPKRVVNWFDNGKTDHFLQITVAKPTQGRSQLARARPTTSFARRPGGRRPRT